MKKLVFVAVSAVLLFLAGCWNYTEAENLTIVSGMSIDYEDGKYKIRAEIIDLSGSEKGSSSYSTSFLEGEGESISQAVSFMVSKVGHKLYWDHAEVYVISRSVAQNGISDVIDWFLHENLVRITSLVVMSDGETASEIFDAEALTGKSVAFSLEEMLVNYSNSGDNSISRIYALINRYHNVGMTMFIPIVGGRDIAGKELVEITGMAVFSEDYLAEEYGLSQTKSIVMLLGGNNRGEYEVDIDENVRVSVKNNKNSIDVYVGYEDGIPKAKFVVEAELLLTGISDDTYILDAQSLDRISKCTEAQIKKEIDEVLKNDITGVRADIGGVGMRLSQKNPKVWRELSEQWQEIYAKLDYTIEVEAKIGISGQASYLTEGKRWK